MNTQTYNQAENQQKTKTDNSNSPDTSEYNLTKEEVAESVIHSLNDAQKFLRGEIKLGKARDFIKQLKKEIAEENADERN